ncbi:MAG: hypothetical protein AAF687_00525 [Pseudomonadota bacterium]
MKKHILPKPVLACAAALAMALPLAPALAMDGHSEAADVAEEIGEPIGQFGGSYTCEDGDHGLYLELWLASMGEETAEVYGVLGFFPILSGVDGRSGLVAGSFEVTGTLTRATKGISLTPGQWIVQPEGYGAAGLEGTIDSREDGNLVITGKPVVPGAPDFCSDLVATGFAPLLVEEEAYAEGAEEATAGAAEEESGGY